MSKPLKVAAMSALLALLGLLHFFVDMAKKRVESDLKKLVDPTPPKEPKEPVKP